MPLRLRAAPIPWSRAVRSPLTWIFLVALAVRCALAALYHARQVEGLTVSFFSSAGDLAAGDPFLVEKGVEILHPYGYSVLILVADLFTSSDTQTLVVLAFAQAVIDSCGVLLVYLVGRNLHRRSTGLWVAALYAVNPMIALASVQPIPEALSPVLIAAILAAVSMIWRDQRHWAWWAGLACGIAVHFRSEFLLLPVGIAAYVLLTGRLRRELPSLAILVALVAASIAPLAIGTWVQTGTPRISTTNAGGTMWQGLGEHPENPWGLRLGDQYVAAEARRLGFNSPWGPEANDHFTAEFVEAVREHPGYYANQVLTLRIPRVFDTAFQRWNLVQYAVGITEVPASLERYAYLKQMGLRGVVLNDPRLLIVSEGFHRGIRGFAWLSQLALLAYAVVNIRHPRRVLLLVLPFAYFVSMVLIKFVEPRLYFPLLPIYTVALGALLELGWRRLRGTRTPAA